MTRLLKILIISALLLLIIIYATNNISFASATGIIYVSKSGNDAYDCLSPATACATINGALAKAAPSDTIQVTAETYYGADNQVVLVEKNITLSGGWNQSFTSRIGRTIVDGQNTRRGIYTTENTTVFITYFTIQNGFNDYAAGGILSYGILTVDHTIVQNNQGSLLGGGGISNQATLILQWSTVRNNSGVGIYNWDSGGPLTVINSTINNNTNGVGIMVNRQNATIINSTISGNVGVGNSYYEGGGIFYTGVTGNKLILRNVTITENQADLTGGGIWFTGEYGAQVLMTNTIIYDNQASYGPDCSGPITSQGYNIIGDSTDCGIIAAIGDQLDVDPKLGPLQDNGGPTYTHWIYQGSPAIDGGNPTGCLDQLGDPLTTDQRGFPRPLDGDGDGNNVCDVGAYEADPNNIPPPPPDLILYVTPGGDNANDCHLPTTACKTIGAAVNKASSGAIVYVSTGTFIAVEGYEVIFIDRDITISGGWNVGFSEQIGYSIIDGLNTRRGVTIIAALSVRMEGLYIHNCLSLESDGGGIYVGQFSKLIGNNLIIDSNTAGNDTYLDPHLRNGGGIGMAPSGRMTLNNSLILGNRAFSRGGGIYNYESTITLNHSMIINNLAPIGGGIANMNGGQIALNHSQVIFNNGTQWGGGIDASDAYLFINNSSINGNLGGGIIGYQMTINSSSISGNSTSTGGGIFHTGPAVIYNTSILNNTANYGNGGGIYSSGSLTLVNTTIAYNRAENPFTDEADGGGIYKAGGPVTQISNATIIGNSAERFGGGIYNDSVPVTLRNVILAQNQAATGADCTGTIHSAGYNLVETTSGCIFIVSTGDQTGISPRLALTYGKPSTIAVKPDSPAIDGGNPAGCVDQDGTAITVDQIGTPRPLDGNSDGTYICDIGAFEYNPAFPPNWMFLPGINK